MDKTTWTLRTIAHVAGLIALLATSAARADTFGYITTDVPSSIEIDHGRLYSFVQSVRAPEQCFEGDFYAVLDVGSTIPDDWISADPWSLSMFRQHPL